jgi:hypothetical protein
MKSDSNNDSFKYSEDEEEEIDEFDSSSINGLSEP